MGPMREMVKFSLSRISREELTEASPILNEEGRQRRGFAPFKTFDKIKRSDACKRADQDERGPRKNR